MYVQHHSKHKKSLSIFYRLTIEWTNYNYNGWCANKTVFPHRFLFDMQVLNYIDVGNLWEMARKGDIRCVYYVTNSEKPGLSNPLHLSES